MQDKKLIECFNLSVPLDLFEEAGIEPDGIVEMYVENGKIIINKPDSTENYVCDSDCACCPIERKRCQGKRNKQKNVRCRKV